jgi:gliding motility-associated-like protein
MNNFLIKKLLFITFILLAGQMFGQNMATYKYRVTAYKMGNNQVLSESNIAEVTPPLSMYIPNAFTPNGDGMNDTFGVAGAAMGDFSLKIYNRWGEKVFDTTNPNHRWNGVVNDETAPSGVYVYKVMAKGLEGGRLQKKGNVTLVR